MKLTTRLFGRLPGLLNASLALAAVALLALPGMAKAQVPFPGDDNPTGPGLLVQAKPKLVVEKIQHDFGRIMDTASVFIDIPFKNAGTGNLEITDTHATCGCTLGRLEKTTYAPGESGILKVEFKPQGKNGPQLQRITIRSNDPVQPEANVSISADVEPVVMIEPKLLQFGEVKKGETRTATVKVIGRTDDFAATFGTVSSDDALSLEVVGTRDVELNGKKMRESEIKVTLKPKAAVGRLQHSASIRTNDPRMPAVTVQVLGEILGDLEAGPARLALGVLQAKGPVKSELKITSRTGSSFKIAEVSNQALNGIELQFAIKPLTEGQHNAYVIEVTGTAPKDAVPIRGEVMIKTDVAGEEMIRIPYFGVVRPQNLGAAR